MLTKISIAKTIPQTGTPLRIIPSLNTFEFEVVTVNTAGQEVKRKTEKAGYFTEVLGNGIPLDLVAIRSGKFVMGARLNDLGSSSYERPQHKVTLQSFFMSKFPVTQAQWRAIANLPKVKRNLKKEPSQFKGDNRPVEMVSWYDAVEFCQRLSRKTRREYRLPSEAEWEYAIRAGTTTPFHFGETITSELANYNGNYTYASEPKGEYRKQTTDVGSFPPNAFGLYDMHGNIWEWCADTWHDNYKGAPSDGSVWTTGGNKKMSPVRGGSWGLIPNYCRSADRLLSDRDFNYLNFGFRVVCDRRRT